MSYQVVDTVLAHSKAKGSDRLVLLVIASHADKDTFECHPSRDLLCREAAMSERNLIYCLKRLEETRELVITRGAGRGNLTTYRICLNGAEKVQAAAPFSRQEKVQDSVITVQATAPLQPETLQQPSPFKAEKVQQPSPFNAEKVQESAPFENGKGCNPDPEKVQDSAERVQNPVIKGAKSGCAYKDIEPYRNHKGTKEEKDMSGATPDEPAALTPVDEVFTYWQTRLDHPQSHLTDKRRKAIKARLNEKYTVEQIKQAIDGCASDPWYMGANDRKTVYDDIELICRSGEKLEAFIAKLKSPSVHNGNGAPHNRGKPTLAERNRAAAEEARRLLGIGDLIEAEAI